MASLIHGLHEPAPAAPRRWARALAAVALVLSVVVALPGAAGADPGPDNDTFATRHVIGALPFMDTVDTTTAHTDADDAAAAAACPNPPPATDASVWYSFTPGADMLLVVSTAGTNYSSGILVMTGDPTGFAAVVCGPFGFVFPVSMGVEYRFVVIDDQEDGVGDGGLLQFGLDEALPFVCSQLSPSDPQLPPGNVIMGTEGDDELRGTSGPDIIFGRGGDDEIDGRGGDDVIFGCDGEDEIDGGNGNDVIFGDSVDFFGNPDSTSGEADEIDGGRGDDQIFGGPGDDELAGGNGDDEVIGNQGDDEISGGRGDDFVSGGFGDDEVDGNNGDDGVFGGFGDDELDGGKGDDFINGDAPNGEPDPMPNHDECDGGGGMDEIIHCEEIDD